MIGTPYRLSVALLARSGYTNSVRARCENEI